MADCVAQEVLSQWRVERQAFLHAHPKPWDRMTQTSYNEAFPRRLEEWSDQGLGSCHLQNQGVRNIVADALHFFQGERYDLISYVIMPNHVHVLFCPFDANSLSDVLHSWKGFTARRINQHLGLRGAFWMDETFDHAVRSAAQLTKLKQYIADNPGKAGLKEGTHSLWAAKEC